MKMGGQGGGEDLEGAGEGKQYDQNVLTIKTI